MAMSLKRGDDRVMNECLDRHLVGMFGAFLTISRILKRVCGKTNHIDFQR